VYEYTCICSYSQTKYNPIENNLRPHITRLTSITSVYKHVIYGRRSGKWNPWRGSGGGSCGTRMGSRQYGNGGTNDTTRYDGDGCADDTNDRHAPTH
jgi:hypothetical protein